jgi:hypothetical protein
MGTGAGRRRQGVDASRCWGSAGQRRAAQPATPLAPPTPPPHAPRRRPPCGGENTPRANATSSPSASSRAITRGAARQQPAAARRGASLRTDARTVTSVTARTRYSATSRSWMVEARLSPSLPHWKVSGGREGGSPRGRGCRSLHSLGLLPPPRPRRPVQRADALSLPALPPPARRAPFCCTTSTIAVTVIITANTAVRKLRELLSRRPTWGLDEEGCRWAAAQAQLAPSAARAALLLLTPVDSPFATPPPPAPPPCS